MILALKTCHAISNTYTYGYYMFISSITRHLPLFEMFSWIYFWLMRARCYNQGSSVDERRRRRASCTFGIISIARPWLAHRYIKAPQCHTACPALIILISANACFMMPTMQPGTKWSIRFISTIFHIRYRRVTDWASDEALSEGWRRGGET